MPPRRRDLDLEDRLRVFFEDVNRLTDPNFFTYMVLRSVNMWYCISCHMTERTCCCVMDVRYVAESLVVRVSWNVVEGLRFVMLIDLGAPLVDVRSCGSADLERKRFGFADVDKIAAVRQFAETISGFL
eukprot:1389311-Amorphochlora_amoeboformis.AAC.1